MIRNMPMILATAFVSGTLLIGGAASAGVYGNAAIQCAATLGIAVAIVTHQPDPGRSQIALLGVLIAALAVPLLQLIPLPASWWTTLPSHRLLAEGLDLAGIAQGPRPLSLVPSRTLGAALGVLPVIAAALIGLRAPRGMLTGLFATIVVIAAISMLLGAGQRMGGEQSPLYFYTITNRGEAVGFFANSNHFGLLCAIVIPVATALFVAPQGSTRPNQAWLILVGIVLLALFGIWLSNSLAAVGLGIVALASIYPIARLSRGNSSGRRVFIIVIVATIVAIAGGAILLIYGHVADGVLAQSGNVGRAQMWPNTVHGIRALLPFGGGMGTFPEIYPRFEQPDAVTYVFANHAHNDYLEALMDGGAPVALLMLAFALWWLRTGWRIWRSSSRDAYAEAAIAVTAIIMLHEIVDYPLRTAAIGVIFGFCCGVMVRRVPVPVAGERVGRHVSA